MYVWAVDTVMLTLIGSWKAWCITIAGVDNLCQLQDNDKRGCAFLKLRTSSTMLKSADKNLKTIKEFGLQLFLVPVVLDYHFFHKKMEKKGKWIVEITLPRYQSGKSVKYDIQLMLFELKLVEKSGILLCRHFKLNWNITAFIQFDFRN